ncbi:hypothetical protein B0T16DRAFT_408018 [Cercophora newfieldiana]|uniref:Uncharacterized protein n=1 Tax=Cercophora newfieldiana TaxID=92897 RepID=A0AA40CT21_9PEZI|nr:hypothetical protein B0T16DRAFT_408018 [Cercophora newfieldiana]
MRSLLFNLLVGATSIVPALANSMVHNDKFLNDHAYVARAAAPDWHFHITEGCYPSSAYWDGKKTPPGGVSYPGGINQAPKYHGCAPVSSGDRAHDFPTYFRVRKCEYSGGHVEYHVLYDVFFAYSTNRIAGHIYDWEWAMVKWVRVPGNSNYWHRKSIVLAKHGDTTEWDWDKFPNTLNEGEEWVWGKNRDRPVIKFGADGHGLEANMNQIGKWYRAADWLSNANGFPDDDWATANAPPPAFEAGRWFDLCWVA